MAIVEHPYFNITKDIFLWFCLHGWTVVSIVTFMKRNKARYRELSVIACRKGQVVGYSGLNLRYLLCRDYRVRMDWFIAVRNAFHLRMVSLRIYLQIDTGSSGLWMMKWYQGWEGAHDRYFCWDEPAWLPRTNCVFRVYHYYLPKWASYHADTQTCGLRMRRECRERFPRHRLQRKPLVMPLFHWPAMPQRSYGVRKNEPIRGKIAETVWWNISGATISHVLRINCVSMAHGWRACGAYGVWMTMPLRMMSRMRTWP